MKPYFADESVTLYHGDALEVARTLDDGSADCIVTSPPYFGLRDYGVEGQYGLESSPAEYVETMRALFAELRRGLAGDGTLWLNVGDSYSGHPNGNASDARTLHQQAGRRPTSKYRNGMGQQPYGIPPKNLLGIPWHLAFALQSDGWILRNAVIWHKPNGMPQSVADRLSSRYEHIFLFSKSRRYWFDLNPIREPHAETTLAAAARARIPYAAPGQRPQQKTSGMAALGANPGDVWKIATQPFAEAHFACMPPALAERCILAGCKPGGVVLDPFSGSGTTGMAAAKHGRRYIGIDLNAEYLDLSLKTRLLQPTLGGGAA